MRGREDDPLRQMGTTTKEKKDKPGRSGKVSKRRDKTEETKKTKKPKKIKKIKKIKKNKQGASGLSDKELASNSPVRSTAEPIIEPTAEPTTEKIPPVKKNGPWVDWNKADFGGDEEKKDKFLRLLGAKKAHSQAPTSDTKTNTKGGKLDRYEI